MYLEKPKQLKSSYFKGINLPVGDFISQCMHCGLCLPTCPTYQLTGMEISSPRGRIRLIKAVAEGDLPVTELFEKEMNFCLDCQACETACPAGVKYGKLVEAARAQVAEQKVEGFVSRTLKWIFFGKVFASSVLMSFLRILLLLYGRFGVRSLIRKTRLMRIFGERIYEQEQLALSASSFQSSRVFPKVIRPPGNPRFRVGFLTGCIMDISYSEVNRDTLELLLFHECEILIPDGQTCCGSLAAHFGYPGEAKELAKKNIKAFFEERLDFIVMNSAGCGAFFKEYVHLFDENDPLHHQASFISTRTLDITEFLYRTGMKESLVPRQTHTRPVISYHDACHLVHTQNISKEPRFLLAQFPAYEYRELPESAWCCGSAGIYNITEYEASMSILDRKIENVMKIEPDLLITGNPGCMVQIEYGLRSKGRKIRLVHTATFLKEALLGSGDENSQFPKELKAQCYN